MPTTTYMIHNNCLNIFELEQLLGYEDNDDSKGLAKDNSYERHLH